MSHALGVAIDTLCTLADDLSGAVFTLEHMKLTDEENVRQRDDVSGNLANAHRATVKLLEIVKREKEVTV